jgi:EAL domain-containing protein (putative c-di-GMP-specific phosphodiesterase class I)/CheY-like chemotaxis protein
MRTHGIADERLRDAHILVVDDEPINVRLLDAILRRAGYRNITTTSDPRSVARLVQTTSPAILLLDLRMPDLDGFMVLDELRATGARLEDLPVLIMTADTQRDVKRRAFGSGAEDFVTKPFEAEEVLLRTHNLLENALLHADLSEHNRRLSELIAIRSIELAEARKTHEVILASLGRLQSAGSPEETATALCSELAARAGFDAVAILAFGEDDVVLPLAACGGTATPSLSGRPVSNARGSYLRDHALLGPWAQAWGAGTNGGPNEYGFVGDGERAALYAPLSSGGRLLGVLAVGSVPQVSVEDFSHRLPTVVDYAAIASALLAPALVIRATRARSRTAVADVIAGHAFATVFQPIVRLKDGEVLGFEALTRFDDGTRPDVRFTEAHALGMGLELEEACVRAALEVAGKLPSSAWLSLNASPDLLLELPRLKVAFEAAGRLLVLEVTEHVPIEEYGRIRQALSEAGTGIRLAIDDAGAGFNSFRHIVELSPDYVKLDLGIVRSIEDDPMRQALVTGLRYFAAKTGCTLIAEGIETEPEREALIDLGVAFGQGFLMGRPAALA